MSHHPLLRSPALTLAAVLLGAAPFLRAQHAAPAGLPPAAPAAAPLPGPKLPALSTTEEIVGPVQMRGDTLDAVLVLVGKWTNRSIIRPQALPATEGYTITLPAMPKSEAVLALETMLDLSGIAVTPLGDRFLKVMLLGQAKTEAPEMIAGSTLDLPPSGRIASKLFVLDFLRVSEIKDQIIPLLNPNLGGPVLFEKTNAMLITDSLSTLQRIEQLIKQLDRPAISSLQPKFYSLQFAKASDLVNKITAILKPPLSNQISSATSLTADDRTNQIVLLSDPRQYPFFDELIRKLDVKADPNTRNEVIYLKHATAKDVASLLTNLVSGRSQAASRTDQGSTRPSQISIPVGTPTGVQPNVPATVQPAIASILGGASPSTDFSSLVTILADDRSNSIVISGTVDDLRLIKEIVEKVDVLLAQVSIQVVIAEVTLSDSDTSGINALNLTVSTDAARGTHITAFDTTSASGGNSGLAGWNVTSGVVNPLSFQAALTNTGAKNNVKILSANTIVTTHNKQAEFTVSQKQPIITGSQSTLATTGTTPVATSTFTYQDIGIDVKVTPLIGDDGSIQLNIDQTVDDVIGSVTIDNNPQPIIGHREATSFINVNDGQMIVLGGLQQTKNTANRTKLGFLYEIPILSNLLGARTNEVDRTELLLFVRPHVIRPEETTKDTTKSIDELTSKDQVKQYLQDPAKQPKESVIDRYYK
jgi:general secretion pathway protein D